MLGVFSGEAEVNTPGTVLIDVGTFHVPYQPERILQIQKMLDKINTKYQIANIQVRLK